MSTYDHSRVQHFIGTRLSRILGVPLLYSPFSSGGNAFDRAPPSGVKDFVKEHGGHTVITKVSPYYFSGALFKE